MKNQLILGVIVALLAGAALFNYEGSISNGNLMAFEQFKADYARNYNIEESIYRFSVFFKTL